MVANELSQVIATGVVVCISMIVPMVIAINVVIWRWERRSGATSGSGSATFHVGRGPWIAGEPDEPSHGNEDARPAARGREEALIREIEEVVRRTTWADAQQLVLEMITNYYHGRDPS